MRPPQCGAPPCYALPMSRKKRAKKSAATSAAPRGGRTYILTAPGGRRRTVSEEEYQRISSSLPKGTMVQHDEGWFVVGASIGDIFEFD